jgi:NitT/TauT family transport system substrate-binding protein
MTTRHRYARARPWFGILLQLTALGGTGRVLAANPLSVGVVNWIGYGPMYVADANGYYRIRGFNVRLVNFSDNSLMVGALQGGELDASSLTYDQVLVAVTKGMNVKVVMPLDYSTGGDAILATAAVKSIADLKGRKVAFQPSSPSDFLLGYALKEAGLTQRDIKTVPVTPDGVPSMMASGAVDAGVTYEPSVSMIRNMNSGHRFHVLLSSGEARGMVTDVLAVRGSTIEKNPKFVDALVRGTMEGLEFMRREPAKALSIIAKRLGISEADARLQLGNVENPQPSQLADVFEPSDTLPSFQASGRIIGDILRREGQIRAMPAVEITYDARFVHALQSGAPPP